MNAITYSFIDNSSNEFILTTDSLLYNPTTPTESSSGFYNGGHPAKMSITTESFHQLSKLFEEVMSDKGLRVKNRTKETVLLKRQDDNGNVHVIARADALIIKTLLSELKKTLQQDN